MNYIAADELYCCRHHNFYANDVLQTNYIAADVTTFMRPRIERASELMQTKIVHKRAVAILDDTAYLIPTTLMSMLTMLLFEVEVESQNVECRKLGSASALMP